MGIYWHDIKSFNGLQNYAFEELVCQIARSNCIREGKKFIRVAAPDGGVEAYCVLDNGDEYGWQAKYFFSMDDSQWNQIEKSFKRAIETHPKLIKYFICIPLDRQDPRDKKKWFMNKWDEKTKSWATHAKQKDIDIDFVYWGSSELIDFLSLESHAGRKLFWFSRDEFSDNWFKNQVEENIKNLGKRYTPELNVELEISKHFDALSRNDRYRLFIKEQYNEFLLSMKKVIRETKRTDISLDIMPFFAEIEYQYELSQNREQCLIDIKALKENLNKIDSLLIDCAHAIDKDSVGNDSYHSLRRYLQEGRNTISDFFDFIGSPALELSNNPYVLLSGNAGVGKSHLLADVASHKIRTQKACIFLLGQHFTTEEPPWKQILRNLLLLQCSETEFLGALSAKAKTQGERLLFIIDAINEGQGRFFWQHHIRAFVDIFKNYPYLGLVLSVRSSYMGVTGLEDLVEENKIFLLNHEGFAGFEYQAMNFFFNQFEIEQPSIPILNPEFSNPLFLKLFCEGLYRRNLRKIPDGYSRISRVIESFLSSINEKLSHPTQFDYPKELNLVERVIHEIIAYKLKNNLEYVEYETANSIADNILSLHNDKRGFLNALISEGVLTNNLIRNEHNESKFIVYLAYERFDNHLTASYLLEKYWCNRPQQLFESDGPLQKYIEGFIYQGLIEALSIQLPEKFGFELYELIGDEYKGYQSIVKSFIYSLKWRKTDTISEKTIPYINEYILSNNEDFDYFFQTIYSVALEIDHFFNANFLHDFLMKFSMSDRDSFWTPYLHDKDQFNNSISRLIDWAISKENKDYLTNDSRILAAKAVAWICTSTNIALRDRATKALTVLLENKVETIIELLMEFEAVNDPYVYERIFAASYGAILRSDDLNNIDVLCGYIISTIFASEEVYPNVLVRDYARNIVEFAIYSKLYYLLDVSVIRPPYRSNFPDRLPTDEDIESYQRKFDTKKWKGGNRILHSMKTEYGRGGGLYGDFGRYVFQASFHDWIDFDANDLSNYACKLIFDNYGYDEEKHGEFDEYASRGNRYKNETERIGKKYQWIALYEVLARLADNYKMDIGSMHGRGNKELVWFQGPWEPFLRNIDPTLINTSSGKKDNPILFNPIYNNWGKEQRDWLISTDDLPSPEKIITLTESGVDWLVLESHLNWREQEPLGEEEFSYPSKYLYYQIRSYFVRNENRENLINWLNKKHLMGRWFPEGNQQYWVFSRELYWSPAYNYFEELYYEDSEWIEVVDNDQGGKVIAHVLPTTERYAWQSGANFEDQPSYFVPRKLMYSKMNFKYSKEIGTWVDSSGEVCIVDSSVSNEGPSNLTIRKSVLLKFLEENNLAIVWTCLGEKNIYGRYNFDENSIPWLEVSGVYTIHNNRIEGNLRPLICPMKYNYQ